MNPKLWLSLPQNTDLAFGIRNAGVAFWYRKSAGLVFWSEQNVGLVFGRWNARLRNVNLAFWNRNMDLAFFQGNAGLSFWNRNVDLVLLKRNAGLNLAFYICKTDCVCRVFDLLSMSTMPSSTLSIPVESQGLLGTSQQHRIVEFREESNGRIDLYHHFYRVSMHLLVWKPFTLVLMMTNLWSYVTKWSCVYYVSYID